jgi:hypothetical protein
LLIRDFAILSRGWHLLPRARTTGTRTPSTRSAAAARDELFTGSMSAADSILAVDPGLRHPAAALFRRGTLQAAARIRVPEAWHKLDVAERCRRIGGAIQDWACGHGLDMDAMVEAYDLDRAGDARRARALRQERGVVRVTLEWPQIYSVSRSKGDPNDLPPLAGIGAAIASRLDVEAVSYKPAQWIRQIKKTETGDPLKSPRGRLIWRCLRSEERDRVVLSHDALDATGLGLHDLGRLRRHIYPGSAGEPVVSGSEGLQ